jgi:membrane protein
LFSLATVMLAASAAVSELRDALDTIWKVPIDENLSPLRVILNGLKDRIFCLVLVAAAGAYLVVSLIANRWIFAAGRFLYSGSTLPASLVQVTGWVVSFAIIAALFAFVFKVLPRVPVRWSDVAIGAIGTALLFSAGKFFLGLYLAKADFANTYGAAGSLVVVLVWVYYSAQVVYLGAEFTQAYAHLFGSRCAHETATSVH